MKLVTLECPCCGAKLDVNPELKFAGCNYCGQRFAVDDGASHIKIDPEQFRRAGYEFEQGRFAAQAETTGQALADRIRAQMLNIDEKATLESAVTTLRENLDRDVRALNTVTKGTKRTVLAAVLIDVLIVLFILSVNVLAGVICTIPVIVATILLFGPVSEAVEKKRREKAEGLRNTVRLESSMLEDAEAERQWVTGKTDLSFLPEKYRTREAMEFFCKMLDEQRAVNVREAANLYEEDLRMKHMEGMYREQMEELKKLRQQNSNAPAEDPGSGTAWGTGIFQRRR